MRKVFLAAILTVASITTTAADHLTIESVTAAIFDMKSESIKKDQTGALKYYFDGTKFYEYFYRNGAEKVTTSNFEEVLKNFKKSALRNNYELLSKDILRLEVKLIQNSSRAEVFIESRNFYVFHDAHYSNVRQSSYIFGLHDEQLVVLELHGRTLANIHN